jgi:two-component system, OmpR family, KDP operon response regulator KdpE
VSEFNVEQLPGRRLTALVADPEPKRRRGMSAILEAAGYRALGCGDPTQALRLTLDESPDLVLIALRLPPPGGLELLQRVRLCSSVPIVALGPDRDEDTASRVLDAGADDYVPTPCGSGHLLARIRAVLRRLRPQEPERRHVLLAGELTVDLDQRRLFLQGREVLLSPTEWQLLAELATHCGRLLLHEELLTGAWGPEYRHDRQYLRVWIRRLRRKLEDDGDPPRYIRTVPGMGYLFDPGN